MTKLFTFIVARYPNDTLDYGLGSSDTSGLLTTRLFPGYNSNQFYIYVQVYDNDEAFSIYKIETPITVWSDRSNLTNLTETITKLINGDPLFQSNVILNEGSYLSSVQEIQTISSLLNDQSLSDKFGLISYEKKDLRLFPQTLGPLFKEFSIRPVSMCDMCLCYKIKIQK